ncbi:hypothetical protein K505DRAFT_93706 [Melanomma pulvis-pyrius CBS 109.77]|uniref:Uncharacterized protein n=1 Tax=Melanomma pulvis-pyrius CBS 109.77 TaxID=1314802 RepID=A0A6A6XYN9_9PLEO|nr:hypothetical protein K505DRAFT_93706 [Melanomma pulvis-pyrius CBS 109.77]
MIGSTTLPSTLPPQHTHYLARHALALPPTPYLHKRMRRSRTHPPRHGNRTPPKVQPANQEPRTKNTSGCMQWLRPRRASPDAMTSRAERKAGADHAAKTALTTTDEPCAPKWHTVYMCVCDQSSKKPARPSPPFLPL